MKAFTASYRLLYSEWYIYRRGWNDLTHTHTHTQNLTYLNWLRRKRGLFGRLAEIECRDANPTLVQTLCPAGHRGHIACLQQRWAIWDVGSLWKYARCCFRFTNIFPKKACMDFTLAILGMIRWCWHELDVDCWFLAMQPPWSRSWDTVRLKLVRCSTVAACGIWLSNVFRTSFKDCRVLCCFSF